MSTLPISPRMRRMQWIAIALATFAIAVNYIDRSTLAVGNVKIRAEFGLTATEIGQLQSAWSITYAFFQVPVGFLLGYINLMMVSPMGPFMTELFPTAVRGVGRGF